MYSRKKHGPKVLIGSVTLCAIQSDYRDCSRHSSSTYECNEIADSNSRDERVRYGDLAWNAHEMTDTSSAMINNVLTLSEFIDG